MTEHDDRQSPTPKTAPSPAPANESDDAQRIRELQQSLEAKRAALPPAELAPPMKSAVEDVLGQALKTPTPEQQREAREREVQASHAEEIRTIRERQKRAAALRTKVIAMLPSRMQTFDAEFDAVERVKVFGRAFRLFPRARGEDSDSTLEDYASQSADLPLWLLDVALCRIVDDEAREFFRPTVGEIRKVARKICHSIGFRGDVFRHARVVVGQPSTPRTLIDHADEPAKLAVDWRPVVGPGHEMGS